MGVLTKRRTGAPERATQRMVWQCASLLLDYPDETQRSRLDDVRAMLAVLGEEGRGLEVLAGHLADAPLTDLQTAYVETFDQRRRCNLFLTYFAHGDTRKRGTALLRFKQTYLAAGVEPDDRELPDHLCMVLEFAATVDADAGLRLLTDHRASLEMLRISLRDAESPWAAAVEAVCATLPPLRGEEHDAVLRLIAEGPPAEEVGLAPYGGPAFDALLAERRGPVDLPMPEVLPR